MERNRTIIPALQSTQTFVIDFLLVLAPKRQAVTWIKTQNAGKSSVPGYREVRQDWTICAFIKVISNLHSLHAGTWKILHWLTPVTLTRIQWQYLKRLRHRHLFERGHLSKGKVSPQASQKIKFIDDLEQHSTRNDLQLESVQYWLNFRTFSLWVCYSSWTKKFRF